MPPSHRFVFDRLYTLFDRDGAEKVDVGATYDGGAYDESAELVCGGDESGFQQTLRVAQLETLVTKFGFQKQALSHLCTTNATTAAHGSPPSWRAMKPRLVRCFPPQRAVSRRCRARASPPA